VTGTTSGSDSGATSGYRPSPRPTFDAATAIRHRDVVRYTWGDDESGEVLDWLYVSSGRVHQLVFGLAGGQAFRHSDQFRTIFAADEVLYVLSGTMMITHPVSGEAHRVETGEAVFFRRDTWHHAYALGDQPLRVLEFFSPPPSAGSSGAYARSLPLLTEPKLADDSLLGDFVPGHSGTDGPAFSVLRPSDLRWRLEEGVPSPVPVGLYASTEHLTVGCVDLTPGQRTAWRTHDGDLCGYVLRGPLSLGVEGPDARKWFELEPGDGWFVPAGVPYRFSAHDGANRSLFAVAPSYRCETRTP
jgi:quercetin dioxygenase-like cupin family protein